MLRPVSGLKADKGLLKPYASIPGRRLEFLQRNDVFFSDQSYRAQLQHFLSQKPDKPLMFSFVQQDHASVWDRIFPATQRDVILLHPVHPATAHETAEETPVAAPVTASTTRERHTVHNVPQMASEDTMFDTILQGMSKPDSPKSAMKPFSPITKALQNPFAEKALLKPSRQTETAEGPAKAEDLFQVNVREFTGNLVAPQLFHQLDKLFSGQGLDRTQPVWVRQVQGDLVTLAGKNPQQAGFQQFNRPITGMIYQILARILAPLLGLKITDNMLKLPNGAAFALNPTIWKDVHGKTTDLYQVVALPDGRWLKLQPVRTAAPPPSEDQKALRKWVETRIEQLEQTGKTREVSANFVFNQAPGFSPNGIESALQRPIVLSL